ncbi:MAG: chemotaxis response regulator protein-glutamate methylesterase [Pseudomonadota bacterium]
MARKPRVLIVDDSPLMRRVISRGLAADGKIEVVGEAGDTAQAQELLGRLKPDVMTLDVEMPGMNGIAFLRRLMHSQPIPVIMVSSHTAAGADTTLEALNVGAFDAIAKPAAAPELKPFLHRLRERVTLARLARVRAPGTPLAPAPATPPPGIRRRRGVGVVALGASTGGVAALGEVLAGLPASTPPLVIAQHMPAQFTGRFAERLNRNLPHRVCEARDDEILRPGDIRIAPGDRHLRVENRGGAPNLRVFDAAPVSGHRPSVDVLFRSVAEAFGPAALGVILTGMGRDGADGLLAMRRAGAICLGQSEDTCVVYGMPRAALENGAVEDALPLSQIASRMGEFFNLPPATNKR